MESELRGRRLAWQLIAQLPSDQRLDAHSLVRTHPELQHDRSAMLELAFEEYCRRCDAGEAVRGSEFADRFSIVRRSLRKLIEVDEYIKDNSVVTENMQQGVWPDAGDEFLGFELLEELGRGALSRVFLARESQMGGRQVVAKVCLQGAHEAWTLGRLQHPGVVPVFSIQHDDVTDLSAICMPYLSRATLFDVIECVFAHPDERPVRGDALVRAARSINAGGTPRPGTPRSQLSSFRYADAAVDVGIQLGEALAYTHGKGVLHCDIKPTNVLLCDDGQAMLLDFNLSVDDSASKSSPGGTLPYMAPELLRTLATTGESGPKMEARDLVDPRIDIYSLGVTLYELLSGRLPFAPADTLKSRAEVAAGLLLQHEHGHCVPLHVLNPQVDERLSRIVSSCIAFEPGKRPKSAEALVRQLRRYRTIRSRVWRFSRRHQRALLGSAMALAVCAGLYVTSEPGRRQLVEFGLLTESDESKAERLLRESWTQLQQGEYAGARDGFSQVLELQPLNDVARFGRGRAQLGLDRPQLAAEDFQEILTHGSCGIVHANLAYCLGLQRSYLDAAIHSEYAEYHGFLNRIVATNWAECYLRMGAEHLDQAANLTRFIDPKTAEWEELYLLARVRTQLAQWYRFKSGLRKKQSADGLTLRSLDPADATNDSEYKRLLSSYRESLAAAKQCFDRLYTLPNTHPDAYVTAAQFYLTENPEIGTENFNRCVQCICLAAEKGAKHSYLRSTVSAYSKLLADPCVEISLDARRNRAFSVAPLKAVRDPLLFQEWPLERIEQQLALRAAVDVN